MPIFLKLLVFSLFLILLSLAGLGLRMLLIANGSFPETHISRNKEMKKLGLNCAQKTDIGCNPSDESFGCSTCSGRRI